MVKSPAHYVGYGARQARQLHDTPNIAGEEQNHSVTLRFAVADSTILFFFCFFQKTILMFNIKDFGH
jgi:hypothetical protein